MSKMGQVNFDLQEQAEELGFETVQEALDNGYHAYMGVDGSTKLVSLKPNAKAVEEVHNMIVAEMSAHEDYEHRRKVIVDKLEMLRNDTPYDTYKSVLTEAIEFIKEKEI